MRSKKGQMSNIIPVLTAVLIIGLVLGVGFLVLGEFKSTLSEDVNSVSNEITSSVVNSTGVYLSKNYTTSGINCYNNFVVVSVVNSSGNNLAINTANYTYNSDGKIWSRVNDLFNNTLWNVTYTYQDGDEDCESVVDTINATTNVNDLLPIIVIVVVVGVLLAILFGALSLSRKDTVAQV